MKRNDLKSLIKEAIKETNLPKVNQLKEEYDEENNKDDDGGFLSGIKMPRLPDAAQRILASSNSKIDSRV